MIDAKSLRIGNIVEVSNRKGKIYQYEIDSNDFVELEKNSQDFSPIPLTPDILLAAGFEKKIVDQGYNTVYRIAHETFWFKIYDHNGKFCFAPYEINYQVEITSLHQLQNLFYCLTNKELIIKL